MLHSAQYDRGNLKYAEVDIGTDDEGRKYCRVYATIEMSGVEKTSEARYTFIPEGNNKFHYIKYDQYTQGEEYYSKSLPIDEIDSIYRSYLGYSMEEVGWYDKEKSEEGQSHVVWVIEIAHFDFLDDNGQSRINVIK